MIKVDKGKVDIIGDAKEVMVDLCMIIEAIADIFAHNAVDVAGVVYEAVKAEDEVKKRGANHDVNLS